MRDLPASPALSLPASLAERRSRLTTRLADRATPTEAVHAVRELLDELLTVDLSQRSAQGRQIDERALRIVRESVGLLQAVRATPYWSRPLQQSAQRPALPWRLLGLVTGQLGLGIVLALLLFGAIQRSAAGGDAAFAFGLTLALGLIVLQVFTGYHVLRRPRSGRADINDQPKISLTVDGPGVISTLTQALVAVDQLEQIVVGRPEEAPSKRSGLAEYPELLRAIQQVYAARRSENPERARQRAEGLRAGLEQYGVELHDEWTRDDPPPPELFTLQRSLDGETTPYRVVLPAVTDEQGVILPGRVAVPAGRAGAISTGLGPARSTGESPQ